MSSAKEDKDKKSIAILIKGYPEMKKFKMDDLTSSIAYTIKESILPFSSVRCMMHSCDDLRYKNMDTVLMLGHFIAAYEYNRSTNKNFSITSVPNIGITRASKIMQILYDLSDGKYDPEPELRIKVSNKCKELKNRFLVETKLTCSSSIEYGRIIEIIDEVYGYNQNGGNEK